jgi:AcrR family transcriptional regulator
MSFESVQKDLILKVAQGLFAHYGFKKTSMDEIACGVHISKATIYTHFSGKEAVFAAVVRSEGAALIRNLERAVAGVQGHEAKIRTFLEHRMARLKELSTLYKVSEETITEWMPMAEQARQDSFQQQVKLLEQLLVEGKDAGVFQFDNPNIVALAILSAVKGLNMIFRMKETPELEEGVSEMLKLLFRGLTPDSGRS